MTHGSSRSRSWRQVFGAPILIAMATLVGLLAALLCGEVGRYVAWMTVGAPVTVIIWILLRRGLD